MKKSLSLIAVLIFVLTFGELVFAQNSNVAYQGNTTSNRGGKTRSSGRRRYRRGRRRTHRRAKTGGNTNA